MAEAEPTRETIVDFLADLFARRGAQSYLGERVSMAAHMLQTGTHAARAGAPDALVAASLLHDVGHYTGEFPEDALERGINNRHEALGARFLAGFFPPEVTEPIRLHVDAKRYLCAVEPGYFETLSPASVHSLGLQGGPMTPEEVAAFRANPHHEAALALRRWDEAGKDPGAATPGFENYRGLLERLVAD
ncbi:MAG: HD domain-containing protein [Alphaproteobacteria bacterium]